MFDRLTTFINRMDKLGIDLKLDMNFPWIYIKTINGKRVTETFMGEHGFTVAFLPICPGQVLMFTDTAEIFKLIRKYIKKG